VRPKKEKEKEKNRNSKQRPPENRRKTRKNAVVNFRCIAEDKFQTF
jgi:hypothetical protein